MIGVISCATSSALAESVVWSASGAVGIAVAGLTMKSNGGAGSSPPPMIGPPPPRVEQDRRTDRDEHDGHDEQRERQAALLARAALHPVGAHGGGFGAGGQNA